MGLAFKFFIAFLFAFMSFASFVLLPGYLASKISRQRWNIFVLFYLYAQTKNCYSFPSVFQPSPIHPERLQQWRPSYPPPGDQASVATGRTSFAACAMASSSSALITECSMPSMLLPSMKPPLIAATSRTSFAASDWPLHPPLCNYRHSSFTPNANKQGTSSPLPVPFMYIAISF